VRDWLIPNQGRWSPFTLSRHIQLGEGTLITNCEEKEREAYTQIKQ